MARVLIVLTFVLASADARAQGGPCPSQTQAVGAAEVPSRPALDLVAPGLLALDQLVCHDPADDTYRWTRAGVTWRWSVTPTGGFIPGSRAALVADRPDAPGLDVARFPFLGCANWSAARGGEDARLSVERWPEGLAFTWAETPAVAAWPRLGAADLDGLARGFTGCRDGVAFPPPQALAAPRGSCRDLGLTACVRGFDGWLPGDVLRCYGPGGAPRARVRERDAQALLGCSADALAALVRAGDAPCARRAPLAAVDGGRGIAGLLAGARVPAEVCLDVEGRIATFEVDGASVRYAAQPSPGGGNARGTNWELRVPDAAAAALGRHAFARCAGFTASHYCTWHLAVRREGDAVVIAADDVAPPCREAFTWDGVFAALDADFRGCPAR